MRGNRGTAELNLAAPQESSVDPAVVLPEMSGIFTLKEQRTTMKASWGEGCFPFTRVWVWQKFG